MRRSIWVRGIALGMVVLLVASAMLLTRRGERGPELGEGDVLAAPLATPGMVTVSGTIRHEGSPVQGVQVMLGGELTPQETTTGADGVYTFTGVPTGTWAIIRVRPPLAQRLEYRNTRIESITGDVVRDFDLLSGFRLQGTLYEPDGSPTSMARWLPVEPRGHALPAGEWTGTELVGGEFDLVLRPGIYEITFHARPMPYFLPHTAVRMDGDLTGLTISMTGEIPLPFPVEPPDATKISVSAPDAAGYAAVTGSAGAVGDTSPILIVNLNARNMISTTAAADGSFSALLYAPPGSTLLIKTDRMGGDRIDYFWWDGQQHAADTTINNVTPLPGTMVRVGDTPPATDTVQAFSQVGGFFRQDPRGWAGWWMMGELQVPSDAGAPGLNVAPGAAITVAGTLRVTAPAISCTGTVTPWVGIANSGVMPLFGADGRQLQSKTQFNAQLFTPTGLPIEHEAEVQVISTTAGFAGLTGLTCLSDDVFEGHFEIVLPLPLDLPEGTYRPSMIVAGNVPQVDAPVAVVWFHTPEEVVDLPTIRVGDAAEPRIPWMLFSNVPVNGHRGVVAREDVGIHGMTTRVRFPPHKAIVPRLDERTGEPIVYRMAPDANWVTGTERRLAPPPHVPLKFPGGQLIVEILKPDGGVDVLEAPSIPQSLLRTPTTPGGNDLDEATGQVGDILELYAGAALEYAFEQYGDHIIFFFGEVEDIYGNVYPIHKTYDVTVARVLDIDPGQLPTTPYVVGDAFAPGLHVFPQVPADVAVDLVLMKESDPAQSMEAHVAGKANRFGVYQPAAGTVVTMTDPGEFRVDITAVYTDPDGTLWAGATTWGNVVAPHAPQIAAHGRRGMDYGEKGATTLNPNNLAWFVGKSLPEELVGTEVYYPYFSGDVHWGGQDEGTVGDSIHTILTAGGPDGAGALQGAVYDLLESHFPRAKNCYRWPPTGCTLSGFQDRAAIGEAPLFITTATGDDPVVAPEEIDLWGYWYGSSERPDVHVREILSEDGMGTAYWRFDDTYGYQIGEPADGDHEGDMKWEFGGLVLRETGPDPIKEYAVYSSFWVLLPKGDAVGTRVTPPFRGANGTSIDGGPLMTLKGEEIDVLFLPKGVRPGDVLEVGGTIAFAGHVGPPLDSRVSVTITSPSGTPLTADLRANRIGWVYDPGFDVPAWEPGRWTVDVYVEHDRDLAYAAAPTGYNTGTVLGTSGRYEFYVVEEGSPKLFITSPDPGFVQWTTEGIEPIHITGVAPEGSTTVHYTVHDKGVVMDQGTVTPSASGAFTVTYDAETLNQDFPMLSLTAHEGRWEGLADEVAINMLAMGGEPRANAVTLIGEEVFIGNEVRRVYLPLVVRQ